MSRQALKDQIITRLSLVADEHSLGHQASKADRYSMKSTSGAPIELMFQKDEKSPANLWVLRDQVLPLIGGPIRHKHSEASSLNTKKNAKGEDLYGRHTALKPMPLLGMADLICFSLSSIGELNTVLATLAQGNAPQPILNE